MFCRIFNLLLGGRRSYFREEEKGLLFQDERNFSALRFLLPVPIISPCPPGARAAPLNPIQLRREVDHGDAGEDARLSCGSGICRPTALLLLPGWD